VREDLDIKTQGKRRRTTEIFEREGFQGPENTIRTKLRPS
jgi:hypothetical protein